MKNDVMRFRRCQWLDGEPRERAFCGNATLPESAYCAEHHGRVYNNGQDEASNDNEDRPRRKGFAFAARW